MQIQVENGRVPCFVQIYKSCDCFCIKYIIFVIFVRCYLEMEVFINQRIHHFATISKCFDFMNLGEIQRESKKFAIQYHQSYNSSSYKINNIWNIRLITEIEVFNNWGIHHFVIRFSELFWFLRIKVKQVKYKEFQKDLNSES